VWSSGTPPHTRLTAGSGPSAQRLPRLPLVAKVERWAPRRSRTQRRAAKTQTQKEEVARTVLDGVAQLAREWGDATVVSDQHLAAVVKEGLRERGVRRVEILSWTRPGRTEAFRSMRTRLQAAKLVLADHPDLLSDLSRVREKISGGQGMVDIPRTTQGHCDTASALAAAVAFCEHHPPVRPMQPSQGWKKRAQEDRRRELVSRHLVFRNDGPGIHPPRDGSPGWDQGFRR